VLGPVEQVDAAPVQDHAKLARQLDRQADILHVTSNGENYNTIRLLREVAAALSAK